MSSASSSPVEALLRRARAELEASLRAGTDRRAESLLASYPDVAADPDAAIELVYTEFVIRQELGQKPTPAEWYARFPRWKADLEQMFQVHDVLCEAEKSLPSLSRTGHTPVTGGRVGRPLVIPGYVIQEEIGRGGMGVVYKAVQSKLNRTVALKVILSGPHAGEKERERFRREAESAAKLDHPNVVRIYEVGEAGGRPYCVMEYVGGGNLADYPKGNPWPPRRAAEFIGLLARAAHHAHDRGIVHRDLKPANVLLQSVDLTGHRPDGSTADSGRSGPRISPDTPRPKIADFGLAKVLEGSDAGPTRTGDLVGTPAYMAPEQAAGRAGVVSPATDVWALGVLLYELLTGHLPFQGESTAETLLMVSNHEPILPRQLRPNLPPDLQTICLKCLSKSPLGRYAAAADLADDLDRWLAGEPIRARPIGPVGRFRRWCGRNPVVAGLLAVVFGLSVGGSILFAYLWRSAEAAQDAERRASRVKDGAIQQRETALEEKDAAIEALEHQRYGFLVAEAWKILAAGQVGNVRSILADTPARFRNLEWDYLTRLNERRTVTRPDNQVWIAAVHPDGERVVFVESPHRAIPFATFLLPTFKFGAVAPPMKPGSRPTHRVAVRDVRTNTDLRSWSFSAGKVLHVSLADHGKRLVVLANDPALTVWDVETGTVVHELAGIGLGSDKGMTPPAETFPLPRYIAAASADSKEVRFWDAQTGQQLTSFRSPTGDPVESFTPSPDNETYIVTTQPPSGPVNRYLGRVGDTSTPKPITREQTYFGFDPSGRFGIARAEADDVLIVADVASGRARARLRIDTSPSRDVAISRDGRFVAARSSRGVAVWELTPGNNNMVVGNFRSPDRTFDYYTEGPRVEFTSDNRLAVTVQGGVAVHLYDTPGAGCRDYLPAPLPPFRDTAFNPLPVAGFHPTNGTIWVADGSGFSVWDPKAGRRTFESHMTGHQVHGAVLSRDGSRFAVVRVQPQPRAVGPNSDLDSIVDMWATSPPRKLWSVPLAGRHPLAIAFRPDGAECVVASRNGKVTTLDAMTGDTKHENQVANGGDDPAVVLGPDTMAVYWMNPNPTRGGTDVVVSAADDGHILRRFRIPEWDGRVWRAEFLDDRRMVVWSWATDTVQVWDGVAGTWLKTLPGTTKVYNVRTTPDARRVIGLSSDFVAVWDADTGQKLIAIPNMPADWVAHDLALRPDGKQLAVVGVRGQVRLWTLKGD